MPRHFVLAAVLAALIGVQSSHANTFHAIDLGPAGSSIAPFTPIPFMLPALPNGGPVHYVFENQGVPMGHMQLHTPTNIYLALDAALGQPPIGLPQFFFLTDMNHQILPSTGRGLFISSYDPSTGALALLSTTDPPISPDEVEPGGYFHDIHFEFDLILPDPTQAWLVLDQEVWTDTWVPEPSSCTALAGLGLIGLAIGRRGRKRAKS